MTHLVITGSRDWKDESFINTVLDIAHETRFIRDFYHGGARGADSIGMMWAELNSLTIHEYLPPWDEFGPAAGPIRNKTMLNDARKRAESENDSVLVIGFRTKMSTGTSHMIDYARGKGIETWVFDR